MTKKVLIVGSGAAGTAAAYSLSHCPEKFEVQVWEKSSVPGGVATSSEIKGGVIINDGVQGGCPTYRNLLNIMKEFNLEVSPVKLTVSFGKGKTAWTNYAPSELTEKLKNDIARFEKVLKIINKFEAIFIFLPIAKVLKWYGFSEDFCNYMVFPLTALFFGTGNQTPFVSSAIMARVFLDDDLRLFDYDSKRLLSQTPEMFAFPKLEDMYKTIMDNCGVRFHGNRSVEKVSRCPGKVTVTDHTGKREDFDEIIFACDAETALKVLDNPTFMEQKALGNVRYFNDLIITHEDEDYMNKYYELHKDVDQYFIHTDEKDPEKIEMSFNLTNYQPHLRGKHSIIYQTIYLNDQLRSFWTEKELNPDKILLRRWWRQFAHSWHHYAFVVPLVRYIQGKQNSWYCGAYTLINTHEIATISGLAAAHRLGAPYPFPHDKLAAKQFDQYLLVIHGQPRSFGLNKNTLLSYAMAPFMLVFAGISLLVNFLHTMFFT